ncbi:MAG: DUF4157 domain-containing protein [Pseudomonadota bacterium]|nr:DUF4157 domain-containing protein [Pseudomonadota bacterium]
MQRLHHEALPARTSIPRGSRARVNSPGDRAEQEADQVAKRVTQMPTSFVRGGCSCGGRCPRCRAEHHTTTAPLIQAKAEASGSQHPVATSDGFEPVIRQPGQALDRHTREFMESRFAADFGQVRLHSGTRASDSARRLGARAYTLGNDIVLGRNLSPATVDKSLLAHELTHVLQQRQSGSEVIQRDQDYGESAASGASTAGVTQAERNQAFIDLACQVIDEIQTAVEEGQTWFFEAEMLLQGEEWLGAGQETLVDRRAEGLRQLVVGLDEVIRALNNGNLTATAPLSRAALGDLWRRVRPASELRMAVDWTNTQGFERNRRGVLETHYPSLDSYITISPGSPPGMLQPRPFSTWWVLGCYEQEDNETESETREQPVSPAQLGLPLDSVIYLSGPERGRWDWEPRRTAQPEALGRLYDWHYDESRQRVFIIVDGQQWNLMRNRRLQRE